MNDELADRCLAAAVVLLSIGATLSMFGALSGYPALDAIGIAAVMAAAPFALATMVITVV